MTTKEIRATLQKQPFDSVRLSKDGIWTVKYGYFYRHGMTPQKIWEYIQKKFPTATLLLAEDRWKPWAQGAYMIVQFTIA